MYVNGRSRTGTSLVHDSIHAMAREEIRAYLESMCEVARWGPDQFTEQPVEEVQPRRVVQSSRMKPMAVGRSARVGQVNLGGGSQLHGASAGSSVSRANLRFPQCFSFRSNASSRTRPSPPCNHS
jgi:hypothetical protein